jgi:uncharacterized repeat protein (TIGR03803 family)
MRRRRFLSRRQYSFLVDALESRYLLSNSGYALSTLASFTGGTSASQPVGTIVRDSTGDLFGVSSSGGANHDGTIWELPSGGTLTVLASFNGASNGMTPVGGLVMDASGNLYGVTSAGGANGAGTIFEFTPSSASGGSGFGGHGGGTTSSGTITVLASFASGSIITGGLALSGSTLYGTTNSELFSIGTAGTVITPVTSLVSNPSDVVSAPIIDPMSHDIYVVASGGGPFSDGYFISVSGGSIVDESDFNPTNDPTGAHPTGTLFENTAGTLFGVTTGGADGAAAAFEIPTTGTDKYDIIPLVPFPSFSGPSGGIYENTAGTLFGVTTAGGTNPGGGTAFEIPTTGAQADMIITLANFSSGSDPQSGFVADTNGDLFTATSAGDGALIELTPVHLAIVGAPALVGSGQPINLSVELEGPTGTVITGDDSAITLALNTGSLNGTTVRTSRNGVATFNSLSVVAPSGGFYTITATDSNNDAPGVSATITVAPQPSLASTKLVFTTITPAAGATTIPEFEVDIENAAGNIIGTDDSAVTVSIASGPSGGVLGTGTVGAVQIAQAVDGIATFTGIPINEVGNYKLVASDATLKKADSNTFDVAAAGTLTFITQPAGFTAHNPSTTPVQVEFLDQFGNVITNETHSVSLSVSPANGGSGDNLKESTVKGIATFKNLHFPNIGTYTLTASSTGATDPAVSDPFVVAGGAAVRMVVLQQPPSATTTGAVFGLTIELLDKYGNPATSDSSTVTLSEGQHNGAQLAGTLSVEVVNGLAVFTNLTINRSGAFKLIATDSGSINLVNTQTITVS